jgi:hypothetical protein
MGSTKSRQEGKRFLSLAVKGDKTMKFWTYVALAIFLAVTYFFFVPIFALSIALIILYVVWKLYNFIQRLRTPHGKRIKHRMLRSFLQGKYGDKDGTVIYRDMVRDLKGKGYR